MQIPYKVIKTRGGKLRVKYACPKCKSVLENELAEAGHKDTCPDCAQQFIVPGIEKRKEFEEQLRQQAAEKAARDVEAQRQAQDEERIAEEREQKMQEAKQRIAEEDDRNAQILWEQEQIRKKAAEEQHNTEMQKWASEPSNFNYPSLDAYSKLMKTVAFGCTFVPVLLFGFLGFVGSIFTGDIMENGLSAAISGTVAGGVITIMMLPMIITLFVLSELVQLLMDIRRDIAKLVAKR